MKKVLIAAMMTSLALTGCVTDSRSQLLATEASAVQLRIIQTRSFETTD
jgi:outer membrane lipoprotein SlyB